MADILTMRLPALLTLVSLAAGSIVPPPWADPSSNPCATQPRGWQLLYWPPDGKCYKIFQIGAPCPETMELGPSAVGSELKAECRCPPGTAQSPRDALCHPIFTRASCPRGQYFAPVPDKSGSKKRWGVCREPDPCPGPNELFWARDSSCYARHSRGPCPKGELLVLDKDGLAACACSADGELGRFRSAASGGCHEHYTPGPCLEPGQLFLPDGTCGCEPSMPHYHPPTDMCYQIGGSGPCAAGQQFVVPATTVKNTTSRAVCACKPKYVLYSDGQCYREHTQGPCPLGQMLSLAEEGPAKGAQCREVPCKRGRLYFARERTCYKIGSRGPCAQGQVVLYDYGARPSVDGISYEGACGCTLALKQASKCTEQQPRCDDKPGTLLINNTCHRLYTRGPCAPGEWLVAQRQPRSARQLWHEESEQDEATKQTPKARCECRPGYIRSSEIDTNGLQLSSAPPGSNCLPPAVGLAKFLNDNFKSAKF